MQPKPSSLYLDMLDDGLYPLSAVSNPDEFEHVSPINLLRIQVFLAILFQRPLIVPEQWAVSSATFLKVAAEVLHHYPFRYAPRSGGARTLARPPFPFRVAYFDWRKSADPQLYVEAFVERAIKNHRIQLTELDGAKRERIRRVFLHLDSEGVNESGEALLAHSLSDILGEDPANWIAIVAREFSTHCHHVTRFPDSKYQETLEKRATLVREHLVSEPSLVETTNSRVVGFRSFLDEVRAKGIRFSDYTRMWKVAACYDEAVCAQVAATGRYLMHRTLANLLRADYSEECVRYYFAGAEQHYDDFADSFFHGLRRAETQAQGTAPEGDIHCWLRKAIGQTIPTKEWRDIWGTVWEFSLSEPWKALRDSSFDSPPKDGVDEDERWEWLIELVRPLRPFSVARSPNDERCICTRVLCDSTDGVGHIAEVTLPCSGIALGSGQLRGGPPFEPEPMPKELDPAKHLRDG